MLCNPSLAMKNLLALLAVFVIAPDARALIPEPDNVLYGSIALDGQAVGAARTDVVVEARRLINGPAIASYRMGSSSQAGNLYALRISVESLLPLSDPNAALPGDGVFIVVTDASGLRLQTTHTVAASGTVQRIDFGEVVGDGDSDGLPDAWETLHFASTGFGPGSLGLNGQTLLQNYIAGTDPNDTNDLFEVSVAPSGNNTTVSFLARGAEGVGYENLTRSYALESALDLGGGWAGIAGLTNVIGANQTVFYIETGTNSPVFYRARAWLQ